jgi:hypothetical protein
MLFVAEPLDAERDFAGVAFRVSYEFGDGLDPQ